MRVHTVASTVLNVLGGVHVAVHLSGLREGHEAEVALEDSTGRVVDSLDVTVEGSHTGTGIVTLGALVGLLTCRQSYIKHQIQSQRSDTSKKQS